MARTTIKSLLRKAIGKLELQNKLQQEANDLQRVTIHWLEKVVEGHGLEIIKLKEKHLEKRRKDNPSSMRRRRKR